MFVQKVFCSGNYELINMVANIIWYLRMVFTDKLLKQQACARASIDAMQ
jgi:hypothetical protein